MSWRRNAGSVKVNYVEEFLSRIVFGENWQLLYWIVFLVLTVMFIIMFSTG